MARKIDGCPSRHPKPVIGSCGICKKTVCPDCKAPIGSDLSGKIICKFCYEELNDIQKKINESFEVKIEDKIGLFDKISVYLFGKKEKVCDSYNHIGEQVLGTCIACRKSVCEKCVMPDVKLSTGGLMCKKCYMELYDIHGEISRESKARFFGGLREFFLKLGRTTKLILIIIIVLFVLLFVSCISMFWVFYQLYPSSFTTLSYDWHNGHYKYIIKEDIPELVYEMKDRTTFIWDHWGDPHADYEKEKRKKIIIEYRSIFQSEPEEEEPYKNIYDAIKEYKKQLREQERVEKININNNEN